ncbi:uncharacterized protein [Montipora foliosa]|uniref:uncharacterized protein n=1 Tax=Montipora foliosa TaxID=591990 RepID=UPI0035F1BC9E
MQPIFKNILFSREMLEGHMTQVAKEDERLLQPQKMLVGSFFAKKIGLITPLLEYYLEKGLIVTRIYSAIQYTPKVCFYKFADEVSTMRRAGDAAQPNEDGSVSDEKILAETSKMMGNCPYGKSLTKVQRHQDIKIVDLKEASVLVTKPQFRDLEKVGNEQDGFVYEVQLCKKTLQMKLPLQFGFFVYQYAKLKMLQFYHDCVAKHLEEQDFQLIEMDTDSLYMAVSKAGAEKLQQLELAENQRSEPEWFPRSDTPEHKAYDKRTPGLFKKEYEGSGCVALASKTYLCYEKAQEDQMEAGENVSDLKRKKSTKGLQKSNVFGRKDYLEVLQRDEDMTEESAGSGINRGFRFVDGKMRAYWQRKTGLSYFYCKRIVLEDGLSTAPCPY